MSEVFAYQHTGWRPEIYTLTNLDLHVSQTKIYVHFTPSNAFFYSPFFCSCTGEGDSGNVKHFGPSFQTVYG